MPLETREASSKHRFALACDLIRLTAGSFGPLGLPSGRKQAATEAAGPSLPLKWPVSISNPSIVPDGGPSLMITLVTWWTLSVSLLF